MPQGKNISITIINLMSFFACLNFFFYILINFIKVINFIFSCVEPKYSGIAGMFGAAMLLTGICSGILFGMIMPSIIANISW